MKIDFCAAIIFPIDFSAVFLYNKNQKAIPHKERLATLHAICLQISRHISQKCS